MLVYDAEKCGCECGDLFFSQELSYPSELRRHKSVHDLWARGAVLFKRFDRDRIAPDGIVAVHESERGLEAKVAHKLALAARRAGGYDATSFYPGRSSLKVAPWAFAYLYVEDERAVGYLRVDAATHHGLFRPDAEGDDRVQDLGFDRPPIALAQVVFICAEYRRQGVATRLLGRFAADAGTDVAALAWMTPFTSKGLVLARSICGDELLIGDA